MGRNPAALQHIYLNADLGIFDRSPADYAGKLPSAAELARIEALGFARMLIGVPVFSREHMLGAFDCLDTRVGAAYKLAA